MVLSCLRVRLSINGNSTSPSETKIIILSAESVAFEEVNTTISITVYSDATNTLIGQISAPAFHLNTPSIEKLEINHQTYSNMSFSITGPRSVLMKKTRISQSEFAIKSVDDWTMNNCVFEDVKLRELHVRSMTAQGSSSLSLALRECKQNCGEYKRRVPSEEIYCSYTVVAVSSDSDLHFSHPPRAFYSTSGLYNCGCNVTSSFAPSILISANPLNKTNKVECNADKCFKGPINGTYLSDIIEEFGNSIHGKKEKTKYYGSVGHCWYRNGKCLSAYKCFINQDADAINYVKSNNVKTRQKSLQNNRLPKLIKYIHAQIK